MTKWRLSFALFLIFVTALAAEASLYGPWRRYRNETLGIEVPYVDDWVITPLKNGVVFAMQMNPDPYVRLAIGRVPADQEAFTQSVNDEIARLHLSEVKETPCQLKGFPAIRVEALSPTGRILDYYVDHGKTRYWIGFEADNADLWPEYSKSFDLILSDIQFI